MTELKLGPTNIDLYLIKCFSMYITSILYSYFPLLKVEFKGVEKIVMPTNETVMSKSTRRTLVVSMPLKLSCLIRHYLFCLNFKVFVTVNTKSS